ncbi:MAG: efflux RND transporter permease subunit, partial [Gammaproteobacteria bacterium]|nr:efflux RND transporter permease subunit [Gammaproteobacteria bacterium]
LPASVQPLAEIMGNAINEVADYTAQLPAIVAPAEVQRAVLASVAPALRALPGVQLVEVYGAGDEALWVQPDLAALRQYQVPVTAITRAIQNQVLLRPGGYVSQGHQDVLIEARSLPVHIAQLERIPVPGPNGPIPLRDLARIIRSPIPTHNAVLLDGRPSVALTIFKQPGASTVPVTKAVQAALDETLNQLPTGVHWVRTYNQGHLVQVVGADLGRNLVLGGLLAVAVLFWVLGAGRGIWALALSIPLSLLLGIAGLYAVGQSLNLMTLGALTVAVGLLADDAIIVLESIYHRWEQGDDNWAGVWRGLKDIAGPDVTGTLTTVAVFVPMLFVGGLAGLFFSPFAFAISVALLVSLLVSLTLLPLLLIYTGMPQPRAGGQGARWLAWLERHNTRLLDFSLKQPRLTLGLCGGFLLVSVACMALVSVDFLPLPNEGVLLDSYTLPPGTGLLQTQSVVDTMTQRFRSDPDVGAVLARIGSASNTMYTEPLAAGEIQVVLKPGVNPNHLDAIAARLQKAAQLPGVQQSIDTPTTERLGESLSGLPQPFVIQIFGPKLATLRSISAAVTRRLQHVSMLSGIFNNDAYPTTQLDITPRPEQLTRAGLTPAALTRQLTPALQGEVLARIPEGNTHLDLYMRLANATNMKLDGLRSLPVDTPHGWIPLGSLAETRMAVVPNQIRHLDGARSIEIMATPLGPLSTAVREVKAALQGMAIPAGYRLAFGGLLPKLEHMALMLLLAAAVAVLLIIVILLVQFETLRIAGILLLGLPLAFTGGAVALVLSGVGLNATGLIGFLTIIGISLNHGIVLLHRARRNEANGLAPEAAVREAVHVRFRPIVLTTLTAVLGMLPVALGFSRGAEPEQGLAIVVIGGLIWSSLLSTNLIPALYVRWHGRGIAPASNAS